MSRPIQISPITRSLVTTSAIVVVALNVVLLWRGGGEDWLLGGLLAAAAIAMALNQERMSRFTAGSLCEVPLLVALLVVSPGFAMLAGVLAGAIPRGRLGNLSRMVNTTTCGLPIGLAALAFAGLRDLTGTPSPLDGWLVWIGIALLAVALDTVMHFVLCGTWARIGYQVPMREWARDVALPLIKNDPVTAMLVLPLVAIGLLLDGSARALPLALAGVALVGIWMALQTTRRQIEARDLKDDFFRAIFVSLARLLEMKDPDTAVHSARVAIYSRDIARALGLSEEEQGRIHLAGLLHDVGKVGVPDEILLKPGRLTDDERAAMQRHARLSAEALQGIPGFGDLVRTVYAHHERIDGSGYPEGIEGDALPVGARILGVADTFEALTSDRPYRKGRTPLEALEVFDREIELFDPGVVEALRNIVLTGGTTLTSATMSDFSDEWARAARHLEVKLDEEHFVLPPERPAPTEQAPPDEPRAPTRAFSDDQAVSAIP